MNYVSILNQLLENKIIAILRLDSPQKAQKGIEALKKGGIQAIEVTLNTPGALLHILHLMPLAYSKAPASFPYPPHPDSARLFLSEATLPPESFRMTWKLHPEYRSGDKTAPAWIRALYIVYPTLPSFSNVSFLYSYHRNKFNNLFYYTGILNS